jgi:hypothetical protein
MQKSQDNFEQEKGSLTPSVRPPRYTAVDAPGEWERTSQGNAEGRLARAGWHSSVSGAQTTGVRADKNKLELTQILTKTIKLWQENKGKCVWRWGIKDLYK